MTKTGYLVITRIHVGIQLDQSQDIVTGNAHVSCKKSYNIDLISAYLPGNSDLHNSSRSNVIELNEI